MEQPSPSSAPVQPPANYPSPVQPSYYQQPHASFQQRRPNLFKRGLRFMLRRAMYLAVLFGRVLAPFKLALGITLPLLAIVGVLTTALLWERIVGPPPAVARVESLPSSPEIEAFFEGQRAYNADQMSATFSPNLKQRSTLNDELKRMTQSDRMAGMTYLRPMYIGGVPLKNGGAMYFYVVNARAPNVNGNVPLSFVFMVDSGGKIVNLNVQ